MLAGHESTHLGVDYDADGRWPRPHPTVYSEERHAAVGSGATGHTATSHPSGLRPIQDLTLGIRPEDAPGATISRRRDLQFLRRADRGRADPVPLLGRIVGTSVNPAAASTRARRTVGRRTGRRVGAADVGGSLPLPEFGVALERNPEVEADLWEWILDRVLRRREAPRPWPGGLRWRSGCSVVLKRSRGARRDLRRTRTRTAPRWAGRRS